MGISHPDQKGALWTTLLSLHIDNKAYPALLIYFPYKVALSLIAQELNVQQFLK